MRFKIHQKLLLTILFANIIVAGSIYFATVSSFDSSFNEYLNEAQAKRLEPMINAVERIYAEEKSWRWIKNRETRQWAKLLGEYVIPDTKQRNFRRPPPPYPPPRHQYRPDGPRPPTYGRPPGPRNFDGPPPRDIPNAPSDTLDIVPAILLADKNKRIIIGNHSVKPHWIPLKHEDNIVGYLGFYRAINLTEEVDQLFIDKLHNSIAWITLAAIMFSMLLSLILAKVIVNPINTLRTNTKKLANGDYQANISSHSNDEIGDLSRDFNQLSKTLSHNLKDRQQWIADISHELRTPVAVLQGELEALLDGVRPISSEAIQSLHYEIIRLGGLINDLHQLSLSDLGSLSYKHENLNIVTIIEDVIEHKQSATSEKLIDVRFHTQKENVVINGDYHRLIQLFYNLLNNSLSYTQTSGNIIIELSVENNNSVIRWCDSEPGVNDADLHKLFERLYRAEASRNRNTGGSGLGLSICKNIVEAHQGTITASHAEIGGVCFTIEIPLAK